MPFRIPEPATLGIGTSAAPAVTLGRAVAASGGTRSARTARLTVVIVIADEPTTFIAFRTVVVHRILLRAIFSPRFRLKRARPRRFQHPQSTICFECRAALSQPGGDLFVVDAYLFRFGEQPLFGLLLIRDLLSKLLSQHPNFSVAIAIVVRRSRELLTQYLSHIVSHARGIQQGTGNARLL